MSDSVRPHRQLPTRLPVPGILQVRILEWVAISFSNAWKWKVKVKPLSCVRLFATPWTAAFQAPPYMGFSRQEYWSGVDFLPTCLGNDSLSVSYLDVHKVNMNYTYWKQLAKLFFKTWGCWSLNFFFTVSVYLLCLCAQSCPTLCPCEL